MSRLHRLLLEPDAIRSDRVVFSPKQVHQLHNVLRLRRGDHLRVFDGLQPVDLIVEVTEPGAGRVVERCPQPPEPRHTLIAYPALLQRDKFEAVIQKLTEVGVAAITPVVTVRGLVREPPDAKRLARWQAIIREATEQCGRGRVTQLRPALPFESAVRAATAESQTLLAHASERGSSVREALSGAPDRVAVFVGPEGGYTDDEVEMARGAGVRLVTLGPRVLRTETASPVLAAVVLFVLGDLE